MNRDAESATMMRKDGSVIQWANRLKLGYPSGCFFTSNYFMSYAKFLDDLEKFYQDRKINQIASEIHPDEALAIVRDKWIQQKKIKELISFIHSNWNSGNCDHFILPLENYLILTHQLETFKFLWQKIINDRLSALWSFVEDLKLQGIKADPKKIAEIDITDFNIFSKSSYTNIRRVVAFHRQFTINGLQKIKSGLSELNDIMGVSKIQQIIEDIKALRKRKIKF